MGVLPANELTTLVAKVGARGPPVYLIDLPCLRTAFNSSAT
jgi:hypothetical protein